MPTLTGLSRIQSAQKLTLESWAGTPLPQRLSERKPLHVKLRSAARSTRVPARLIERPVSPSAPTAPVTGRLKDAAFKIGVLGSGAAVAALGAGFGPTGWRSACIALTCTLVVSVIVAISDHPAVLAHPLRWLAVRWRGSAMPPASPQHPGFPLARYLGILRDAREIAILETRLFLMDDEYRNDFVTALVAALGRGARATIVVVCPCSEAMKRRAKDLGRPYEAVKKEADATIIMLDQMVQDWAVHADRLAVWLTPSLLTQTSYWCGGTVFSAIIAPDGPSHREPHFEYSIDSPYGQLSQSALEQAMRSGMRLERYMRGELKVITDSGVMRIEGVQYLEHDSRLFLVVINPSHVVAANDAQGGSWRHGKHAWRSFSAMDRVDPTVNPDLHTLLVILASSKYGKALTADSLDCVFYQVVR